jgi:erythromycin esterase-like protein
MAANGTKYDSLDEWIGREAISFSLESSEVDAAVDRVVEGLGEQVELLGIGEPMHGVEEFLRFRNCVFRRLVERHGFTAIALESSFPRGHVVDDYILGIGKASCFDDVQETGFSHNFARMAANRELVEWMRSYNAATPGTRVHFYGFDSPTEMTGADSPRQLLMVAIDFLGTVDTGRAASYREQVEPLLGDDAVWAAPGATFDVSKSIGRSPNATLLRAATEDFISELCARRPELVTRSDPGRYADALHHARHARQMLSYHALLATPSATRYADCLGLRDLMMAENLACIVERERDARTGRARVLAFAHNSHLKCGQAEWQWGPQRITWWPAGEHVRSMMGTRYAVIGVGVGTSGAMGIGEPKAGSLEARLMAVPGSAQFLVTHGGRQLPREVVDAIESRTGTQQYFPFTRESLTDFDAITILNSIA